MTTYILNFIGLRSSKAMRINQDATHYAERELSLSGGPPPCKNKNVLDILSYKGGCIFRFPIQSPFYNNATVPSQFYSK